MNLKYRHAANCAGIVLALSLSTAANAAPPEILVLSNRADLISGGDALVEIKVPPWISLANGVKVDVDGVNVNSAFAVRADGRYYGLVTGLRMGDNVLTATMPGGRRTHHDHQPSDRRSGVFGCAGAAVDVQHDLQSFAGAGARRAMQCADALSVHVSDDGEPVRRLRSRQRRHLRISRRRRPTRASPCPTSCGSSAER